MTDDERDERYMRAVANQRGLSVELLRELSQQPLEDWQYALLNEAMKELAPFELKEEREGPTEQERVLATLDRLWDRLGWSRPQLQ
jgi:hypothetical protein